MSHPIQSQSSSNGAADPWSSLPLRGMETCFHKNPQASALLDGQGALIKVNPAFAKLFAIRPGLLKTAQGRFNIFRDSYLISELHLLSDLQKVFSQGQVQSIDFAYPLDRHNKNPGCKGKTLWARAHFVPVTSRAGQLDYVLVQLQDLTNEKQALDRLMEQQIVLQESEASYKAFIENSGEAIWCYEMVPPISINSPIDLQAMQIVERAKLVQANQVMSDMLKASNISQAIGSGLKDSGSTQYQFDTHTFVQNGYRLKDFSITREVLIGKPYYFEISCRGIVENGELKRVWGSTKDVTVGQRYQKKLERMSLHDPVTGMPNRAFLQQEIEEFFEGENLVSAALLLIDLDRFKEINDTLGHQTGDRLLSLIGPTLKSELEDTTNTVVRMGGDEFAVFLPKIRNNQHAVVLAQRLLDALRHGFDLGENHLSINASIGIAYAPEQATDADLLLRFADVAMYHAKDSLMGIAGYSADIDENSSKRLMLRNELGRAITENQLCLYYQPKIDLKQNQVFGFEALIRWNHPVEGFINPGEFIPFAEKSSIIHELSAWVLENAIRECKSWRDQGLMLSVAVNLSARNLIDENMPKKVRSLLNQYDLAPEALELEITESSIMHDQSRALRVLTALHQEGVKLSIDDFGTGYSSLAYLKKLPVQTLKIDSSFIQNMLTDLQDELIVRTSVQLAHSFNLDVVAEGVEHPELIAKLIDMGCEHGQGYFFAKPMPHNQVIGWIKSSQLGPSK